MNEIKEKKDEPLKDTMQSKGGGKKFQGFSMGFLLLLLALVVAVYVVCTILAA